MSTAPSASNAPRPLTPIKRLQVLNLVSSLGGATPDQLAAFLIRRGTADLSTTDSLAIHRKIAELERVALVHSTTMWAEHRCLRHTERWLYRITDRAREIAACTHGEQRRILVAVDRAAIHGAGGWADEAAVLPAAFPGAKDIYAARYRIKAQVGLGFVERRTTRARGQLQLVTLAPGGATLLQRHFGLRGRLAPPPTKAPRIDQCAHHLLTVQAALSILLRSDDHDLIRLWGDQDIRSESRRGRTLLAGQTDVSIPDGRVLLRAADSGLVVTTDIEVLTSKYTNTQIRAKYHALAPAGTEFYSPTARMCERTEALVGFRPTLLR